MQSIEERREYQRNYMRKRYQSDPDAAREKQRRNPNRITYTTKWARANPERRMLATVKARAKKEGLKFDLVLSDITIPDVCPVLGIPLFFADAGKDNKDHSPSIDRFDNSKGYTRDNIRVISFKANRLKSDGTVSDFEKVLAYLRGA